MSAGLSALLGVWEVERDLWIEYSDTIPAPEFPSWPSDPEFHDRLDQQRDDAWCEIDSLEEPPHSWLPPPAPVSERRCRDSAMEALAVIVRRDMLAAQQTRCGCMGAGAPGECDSCCEKAGWPWASGSMPRRGGK